TGTFTAAFGQSIQGLTGESPRVTLLIVYDPSPSAYSLAISRNDLMNEGLRVIRQHRVSNHQQWIFTEHYLANRYPDPIRNDLMNNGRHSIPGPGNDIYRIKTLLDLCGNEKGKPSPQARIDGIYCGVYAMGLPAINITLSLLPRFFDSPVEHLNGLLINSSNPPEWIYNTWAGDLARANSAWSKLKNVQMISQEHTSGSLLRALDAISAELDRASRSGDWETGDCNPVHIILVSDFAYTAKNFLLIREKILRFVTRYKAPVYVHALIYPRAQTLHVTEQVSEYITNPGHGTILNWVEMFRDPLATLIRAVGRPIRGTCWYLPSPSRTHSSPSIDPSTYTFYLFGSRIPENTGWTGAIPRSQIENRPIPEYQAESCFDKNPTTPCGLPLPTDYLFDTSADGTLFTDWTRRHLWFANPRDGGHRTCRARLGYLIGCDLGDVARHMGVDRVTARQLIRFTMGDPLTEIDSPTGIFRDRCKYPDNPEFDCLHKTTITSPILQWDQVRLLWAPWSAFDQFPLISPPPEHDSVGLSPPVHLFVSTLYGLKVIKIPYMQTALATEDWAFIPYQTQKHLFSDSLPGAMTGLPVKLKGFRMNGKAYLLGLYQENDENGFYAFSFPAHSNLSGGPENFYLFDTAQRHPDEHLGRIRDVEPFHVRFPTVIFGTGYRNESYREICFYRMNLSITADFQKICHIPGEPILGTSAVKLSKGEAWFAVDTDSRLILYRVNVQSDLEITGFWFIQLSPRFSDGTAYPLRPAAIHISPHVITLLGPYSAGRASLPMAYMISIQREALEQLPSGSTLVLSPDDPLQTYAFAHPEISSRGPVYRFNRTNREWYPCGRSNCITWGIFFEKARFVRFLGHAGTDLDGRIFLLIRSPDCFQPEYTLIILRNFWLFAPVPLHYDPTYHSFAYEISPLDGSRSGIVGITFPGPVTGIIPPHGTFKKFIVIFADNERNGQTSAVLVPHTFSQGSYYRFTSPYPSSPRGSSHE
ncbi:MAG: hypothetical protein D6820_06025, partial [Lentisphaerae bacterium]